MTTEQIKSIIESKDLSAEYFTWQIGNCNESIDTDTRLQNFYSRAILTASSIDEEKIFALMEHLEELYDDSSLSIEDSYEVLTDQEAECLFKEYIEDYVVPLIPNDLQEYFNISKYVKDNNSDRGAYLNYYDGYEHEKRINGTMYYIYKK